jgi:hypothetical protein
MPGKNWTNEFLIHRLVEFDIVGEKTITEIAAELSVAASSLPKMRDTEEYRKLYDRAKRQSEKDTANRLRESTLLTKSKLATYANEAVDTLVTLMRSADKDSVKLSAACEIMDRDGRFAKVSKMMQVKQGEDGAPMLPEDVASEILEALKSSPTKTGSVQ